MPDSYQQRMSAEINQAFAEKDWSGALGLIDLWCGLYPKHAQGWYWRAGCLMYLGELELALRAARHARKLNPEDPKSAQLEAGLEQRIATAAAAPEPATPPLEEAGAQESAPAAGDQERPQSDPRARDDLQEEVEEAATQDEDVLAIPEAAGSSARHEVEEEIEEPEDGLPGEEPSASQSPPLEPSWHPSGEPAAGGSVDPVVMDDAAIDDEASPDRNSQLADELSSWEEPGYGDDFEEIEIVSIEAVEEEPAEVDGEIREESAAISVPDAERQAPPIEGAEPGDQEDEGEPATSAEFQPETRRSSSARSHVPASPRGRRNMREMLATMPWMLVGSLLVIVGAVSWAVFSRHHVPDLRIDLERAEEIRKMMHASVIPPNPEIVADAECDPEALDDYLRTFGLVQPDPVQWELSKHCLEVMGSEETARQLLDFVKPGRARWGSTALFKKTSRRGTTTDVRSLLVRMDSASRPLVTALGDDDRATRLMAADALACRQRESDARSLIRNGRSSDPKVRDAVASVIAKLAASEQVTARESFELLQWLVADESPQVRYEAVLALPLYEGDDAVALVEAMTRDPSRSVSEAARKVHAQFRRRQ